MEKYVLLQQRFINHPLYQICYGPDITLDSLTKAIKQINDTNDDYEHGDTFDMNALHILCSNPCATDEMIRIFVAAFPSLRSMQSIDGLTPLHVLCSNPNVTNEMIKTLIAAFPSLRSMQSVEGLTPVIMYVKNMYGDEANNIIDCKNSLCLDDFLRHRILREDEIVYMLALDDEMQEELSKLDEIDEKTGLYPLLQIASNESYSLEAMYWLLRARPHLLSNIRYDEMEELKIEMEELKKCNKDQMQKLKEQKELMEQMRDGMKKLKKQVEQAISTLVCTLSCE